ncbi:MAG: proton-conducting transporter membrane subunit [Candidatus Saganbacteria bacterium]|nr:proton-conducting transporter membrane subunit [Candidatus Saganbacteria bacterium]
MAALLILVPLLGLLILNLPVKQVMRKAAFPFACLIFIIQITIAVLESPHLFMIPINLLNPFFQVDFSLDYLSFVMLLCIGIVSLSSLIVARYTIHNEDKRFNFFNLLVLASIGMNGMVMVKDIFSLYVFLEAASLASFIMIAFHRNKEALEGSFKYFILSATATSLMLTAIALLFLASGGTGFSEVHNAFVQNPKSVFLLLSMGIFLAGALIKSGVFPFHWWVPDAYSTAPHATSILLAGIVTKIGGVYVLMRVMLSVFGPIPQANHILLILGILSVVTGALAALGQTDFKRLLSYSSISQIGYIILGLASGSTLGLVGAVFHFFNHATFKSLLFTNAAAVETQTGIRDLDQLSGLASRMPITGATSVIGMLSITLRSGKQAFIVMR